ncbi:hypothetical protein OG439_43170 [Amycolatopsis sp. NBC_01307]|uniref:hypothetical protein n=1 Tax=Amycolatopsis sp. NBC_01307 TaxID=2903561 RepID=UPI002E109B6F|nr:hypothetical protein OG439_43170 [Amycolatopsis sp. NBC_01307]
MPLHTRWSSDEIPAPARPSWQVLLGEQHGIVTYEQLRSYGHSAADVTANLRAGRWRRVLPRVYATFTGELPRPARLHAALRYGGHHAVLSHRTAAEEWGFLPIADHPVEITVPYTSSAISHKPSVVVHRSRALRYTTVGTTLPRTRTTDTILDLAVAEQTGRQATMLIVDLVSRSSVSVASMLDCFQLRPPFRFRSAIRRGLSW